MPSDPHNDRCASLLGQGCDCRSPWATDTAGTPTGTFCGSCNCGCPCVCGCPSCGCDPTDTARPAGQDRVTDSAALAKAVDDLDKVSQRLARAGGMALTTGLTELVSLIGDAGCDLDDVINDLQELADGT